MSKIVELKLKNHVLKLKNMYGGVQMKRGGTDARGRLAYITGVDGLRAIAVLMVIAYHLCFSFAKGGLLGVTVFFVISGFVITRILLAELENTGYH